MANKKRGRPKSKTSKTTPQRSARGRRAFSKAISKSIDGFLDINMALTKGNSEPAPKRRGRPPKDKDMILNPGEKKSKKRGPKTVFDTIFPDDMGSRANKVAVKTGIDSFKETFARMSVANINSPYAGAMRGDYSVAAPGEERAKKLHASIQSSRMKLTAALAEGPEGERANKIEAELKIQAANVTTLQPFFHTPGNAQDAYNLPKSYVEQIRWSRIMYNLNPWIASITDLRAFYSVSKFKLSTIEPFVTQFYEENSFNKHFDLVTLCKRANLSKKKFGEAIFVGTRQQDGVWPQTGLPRWVWKNFMLLEPELVEIKKEIIGDPQPKFFLRPNRDFEELARRLEQNDPSVAHLQGTVSPAIIQKIKSRELIQLDPTSVSAIQVLTDASAERGTPPYQRLFVNYTFEDFVRLALMSQAQRYHFPVELWTIGNAEKGIWPTPEQLERFREMVQQAVERPPFSIFFPPIVEHQVLGVKESDGVMDVKALALDTPIPTPTGWTTMGDLKVGDEVFSGDGTVTKVSTISKIWNDRPTYAVKVGNAEPIIADEDHRWLVGRNISVRDTTKASKVRNEYREEVLKTKELLPLLKKANGTGRYKISVAKPLDLAPVELPLPPYTLGAWLGDGDTACNGVYACMEQDSEIIDNIRADGFLVKKMASKYSWYIKLFKKTMRKAGFVGKKYIPDIYLRASFQQRLALVHGLMDTDGTTAFGNAGGGCRFVNTNYGLVESLRELLLTLGFKPTKIIKENDEFRKDIGQKDCWTLTFSMGLDCPNPFRLTRKRMRVVENLGVKRRGIQVTRRTIESIEPVASVPTKCIQVEHPSATYLAGRDFVVTHNSNMAYAQDQYMIGLGVNKDMILGATSMFSSNESSGNQMFVRMMQTDRDDLESWMKWYFFEPLAQWNNLKVEKNGKLTPILPEFEWEHPLDFKAQDDERKNIKEAYKEGLLDPATWIETVLNRNPEDIKERIRKEIGGVLDNGKMGGTAREEILKSLGRAETKVENPGQEAGMGAEGTEEAGGGGGEIPAGAGATPEAPETPAPAEAGATPEAPPTE